jgi:hypothetical protein
MVGQAILSPADPTLERYTEFLGQACLPPRLQIETRLFADGIKIGNLSCASLFKASRLGRLQ